MFPNYICQKDVFSVRQEQLENVLNALNECVKDMARRIECQHEAVILKCQASADILCL